MKRSIIAAVAFSLLAPSVALVPGAAFAQAPYRGGADHDRRVESRHDHRVDSRGHHAATPYKHYQSTHSSRHHAWRQGERIPAQYRNQRVDYRRHGLRPPPRGQEWVRVDNNYALISAASGLIMALSQIR